MDEILHPVAKEILKRAHEKEQYLDRLMDINPRFGQYSALGDEIQESRRKAAKLQKDKAYQKTLSGVDPKKAADIVESLGYAD